MDRNEAINKIRTALKKRSDKQWSVKGDRGTAYGWLTITAPPARRGGKYEPMSDADCEELAQLLGFSRPVHHQGVDVPAGHDFYQEYIDRAEGRAPSVYGTRYWD